uniref:Serine hydrolase like n=1 Tax=Cyprinus carpio carpio TaxID=630221 RepID=A0A9J8CAQ3_CYPCA
MLPAFTSLRHFSTTTMRRAVSEFRMTVPWGEMRGQVWGPSNGRPVLCLHGWADNSGTFSTLIPLLPKDWRFVAIDFPGHGLSSHRPDGCLYTFPLYVADVRRVVEALQWKQFSIIGHSMGGNVAGIFSALYPEMVDAVVLLDTYGFLPTQMTDMFKNMRKGIDDQIHYDNKTDERKERVYTYEKAKERLKAANPFLSDQSADILLERAVREVEGGFVFTRDFRINLKNIVNNNIEQCLHMLSLVKARVMLLLLGLRLKTQNYSVSSQTIKERLQITQCPGCFWTGSSLSICLFRSWSWLVLEHVCIFWSRVFRMPTSGATSH